MPKREPVRSPMLAMSVSERIRYFESRRSSNVYIVGHGTRYMNVVDEFDSVPVNFTYKGKLRTDKAYWGDIGLDNGGLGVKYDSISFKASKNHKNAVPFSDKDYAKAAASDAKKGLAVKPPPGKFAVPMGMTINFYCLDGVELKDKVANLIEGFEHNREGIAPMEVITGGGFCYNYRLSYPSGLKLNVSPLRLRHDVIMLDERRGNAHVPLSTILRDPRCQNATIHWMACRLHFGNLKLDGKNEEINPALRNVTNYMDHIGGEPVNAVKGSAYHTKDDRQALSDSGTWA